MLGAHEQRAKRGRKVPNERAEEKGADREKAE
jgi:hypothetical protein